MVYVRMRIRVQGLVEENYIMDMWIRDCPPGVASCFVAQVGYTYSLY